MRKATNQLRLLLLTVLAVLTVSIGVQAASGRTPSRQMDRQKSITKGTLDVNVDALTAIQGKTRTAVCSFSDSGYLTYEISDTGIVSCSWGKWYNEGKNINLTIKGKAEGTCTVTVSNSANEETRVIRVTVRRNQFLNTETLTARKGASRTVSLNLRTGTPSFSVSDPSILTCTKKSAVRTSDGSISYAYTIQGNAEGTAYVYFTNSYNEEKTTLKVTVPSSAVIMRAVVIGEVDYPISNKIPACKYDANAMESTLRQTGYADVYKRLNVSKMQIRSAIRNTFAGADSNDISLFYYSGHGGSTGSLYPISNGEEEDITPRELASWLSDVPGTVIVILDCCGSGGVIDKAAGSGAADLFNTCVVNAFAEADVYGKSGELCTGKFRVITACQKDTYSYCASKYSYFTKALVDGVGFDYTYGTRKPSAPADGNRNGTISVYEAWYYINKHVDAAKQKTQYYPLKSATTVFRR